MVNVMDKQLIPAGYKQTEVGVIPEDWRSVEINKLVENGRLPSGLYKDQKLYGAGTKIIKLGDVFRLDIFDANVAQRVQLSQTEIKTYKVNLGDIFIALASVKLEGVGKVMYVGELSESTTFDHNVALIRSLETCNSKYLFYILKSDAVRSLVKMNATQVGTSFLKASTILSFSVPLPEKSEQTAIANALSDVDALIAALEKLINKKSAIKTAAMQQLLTGKKRLPPFDQLNTGYKQTELGKIPGDWEIIDFGDLFQPSITRKSIKQDTLVSFIGMQDVSESAHLINANIIPYNEVRPGFTYFEKNDVLVAKITPCFENGKGCITEKLETTVGFGSTEFHVLRANEKTVEKYLYFITTTGQFRKQLESEMVGSAGHRRVPITAIEKYKIPCSNHVEEQTAIANFLSDMDKDLEVIQQRLHKTQQIKQGMMQELLTGKTRLI